MELPSKFLEQIAINTRPKIEEHMLFVVDKSFHEEHLSQPLQTNNKQFKIAVIFLTAYNGIFNVTNKNNKFYFKEQPIEENFFRLTIPPGAYETESLNEELKRIIIDEGYYSENDYPCTIKPIFSTLGSIIQIKTQGPIVGFVFDDTIGDLLGFNETMLWEEINLSPNPVDIMSFDNFFIHTDIARGVIFRCKRSDIVHNLTMDVDPRYEYIEKFRGGIQWYMMDTKVFISSINFKLKNEIGEIVSFNGQSITIHLSVKEM